MGPLSEESKRIVPDIYVSYILIKIFLEYFHTSVMIYTQYYHMFGVYYNYPLFISILRKLIDDEYPSYFTPSYKIVERSETHPLMGLIFYAKKALWGQSPKCLF